MSQDKSRSGKNWIITLLLASAALLYTFCVFLPKQRAIGALRQTIHEQQMFMVQTERLQVAMKKTQGDLQATRDFIDRWKEQSPTVASVSSVLADITQASADCDVKVLRIEPRESNAMRSLHSFPFELTVEGDFHSVFKFLARIESMPQTIWTNSLALERRLLAENKRTVTSAEPGTAENDDVELTRDFDEVEDTSANEQVTQAAIDLLVFVDNDESFN